MIEPILTAFGNALTPGMLLTIVLGVALGLVFGAMPGLSATMAVALCLPLTYTMGPEQAMALLMGLYIGGISGGLITAILLRIPGTTSSIATTFDGYPMAARGEAGKALAGGIWSSFLGGLVSIIALMLLAPVMAGFAVTLGPHEYFALSVFALTLIGVLSSKSMAKGLAAGVLGMALAMVGPAPVGGGERFTFGIDALSSGFALLPVLIGLFAVSEILTEAQKGISARLRPNHKIAGLGLGIREMLAQKWNFLRSTAIGLGIGILPGMGGGTSNLLAYAAAKSVSKTPEKFGKGTMDGVVASESANNASIGGALIPLLTLGIPGDTVTAMLLGGLMIQGLAPGPLLLTNHQGVVYSVYAALLIANVVMLLLMLLGLRAFVRVLSIPKYVLLPVVMVLCVVGAYGNNNRVFDVITLAIFGGLGLLLTRYGFPLPPLILGFVLGPIIERNFSEGMMASEGNALGFLTHPISAVFLVIAALTSGLTLLQNHRSARSQRSADTAEVHA